MRGFSSFGAAALTLLAAGSATAQATAPAASAPRPTVPSIGVTGFANHPGPEGALRRVEADGDLRAWVKETDAAVVLAKADEKATGGLALVLEVGADGRAKGCKTGQQYGDARLAEGLCEAVAPRARFIPAIDASGARMADAYLFYVAFNRAFADYPGVADRPLIAIQPLPPAPPSGGAAWPPRAQLAIGVVSKLDLVKGGAAAPEAESSPWAGVEMSLGRDEKLACKVVKSSGDPAFDQAACKTAGKAKYDFSAARQPYERRASIHFVRQDGRARGLVAVHEREIPAALDPAAATALKAELAPLGEAAVGKLSLFLRMDAAGAVTGCTIVDSSGADAADVAACAAVRRLARYAPSQDIFGRPQPWTAYGWKPGKL